MIKSMTSIFQEIEGKIFHLICESNAPAEHVKAAALGIAKICDEIIETAQKARLAQEKQAAPMENAKEEVQPEAEAEPKAEEQPQGE